MSILVNSTNVHTILQNDFIENLSHFFHYFRVEFNSKFYHGTGIKFAPFCFKTILKDAEDM